MLTCLMLSHPLALSDDNYVWISHRPRRAAYLASHILWFYHRNNGVVFTFSHVLNFIYSLI
jgi:hypothetical protein